MAHQHHLAPMPLPDYAMRLQISAVKENIRSAAVRVLQAFALQTGSAHKLRVNQDERAAKYGSQRPFTRLLQGQQSLEVTALVNSFPSRAPAPTPAVFASFSKIAGSMVRKLFATGIMTAIGFQAAELKRMGMTELPHSEQGGPTMDLDLVLGNLEKYMGELDKIILPINRNVARKEEEINQEIDEVIKVVRELSAEFDERSRKNLSEVIEPENHAPVPPQWRDRGVHYVRELIAQQAKATELLGAHRRPPQDRMRLEKEVRPTIFVWYFKRSLALLAAAGHQEDVEGISVSPENLQHWKIDLEPQVLASIGRGPLMTARQLERNSNSRLAGFMRQISQY